jgi:hypothetical protein
VCERCRSSIPGWSNPRVYWTDAVDFRCIWEHLGVPVASLGAPTTSLGAPVSANHTHGCANHKPGSANHKPGSTSIQGQISLGITALGTLLVRLEIIATTYHSTIFKTHVFSLYSHLCIYVSIYIRYIWTGCMRGLRTIRGAPEDDDRMNSEIHLEAVIV